jgi:hypothetical protein
MSKLSKALQAASVSDAAGLNVEEIFSTYLYTGNGAGEGTVMQTIENEIDLAGEGGMVWIKSRSTRDHNLQDTERGIASQLASNTADEETLGHSAKPVSSLTYKLGQGTEQVQGRFLTI